MFDHLADRMGRLAEARRAAAIARLAARPAPLGVAMEAGREGLVLSGRGLRRRMIEDAMLRSIAR
jgi:hypothetical protein